MRILITAHSGCNNTKDNSFEHIYSAIKSNADVIEIDIDISIDRILVLSHDPFIYQYSGHFEKTSNISSEVLKSNGIITLESVLKRINMTIPLNLDLKSIEVIEPTIKLLKKLNYTDNIIFSGCNSNWVVKIRNLCDEYGVFLNSQEFENLAKENYKKFIKVFVKTAIKTGAIGLNLNYKLCSEELVYQAHLNGLFVQVWTLDKEEDMKKLIKMNVDGITTHNPLLLKKIGDFCE
ncbi:MULTISPECIES: glycerophosphodiester phosphodiesterase [unclassified Marinitoga]|uniref:glycerophosphodiester phosphodiesterase n=1 Tax=unclassified Marinitoga TaxID=2640159 RepID=UPI0006411007|nr:MULTISPECIES: glycerophosphodiester phosphodiesterase [unclassified Marinitoga]KLO24675.1 hypothetical protein X274_02820 [Marinitoga sp. 1155]NUU98864.1 hypothetical protein [Marinitoga sp. 1154]